MTRTDRTNIVEYITARHTTKPYKTISSMPYVLLSAYLFQEDWSTRIELQLDGQY